MEEESLVEAQKILDSQRIAKLAVYKRLEHERDDLPEEEVEYIKVEIEDSIIELMENGVEIYEHLDNSRRVVFKGKYLGKEVVVKFAILDEDLHSNRKENFIYGQAENRKDQDSFAKIHMFSSNQRAIVQEFCTDFDVEEDWMKPKDRWILYYENLEKDAFKDDGTIDYTKLKNQQNLDPAIKYKLYEIQKGTTKDGRRVFVDYGS